MAVGGEATAATPSTDVIVRALAQYAVSSIAMVVGNKAAVQHLPRPCALVIVQAIGTLALLAVFAPAADRKVGFKLSTAVKWLPIACLFTAMLFTSLTSFIHANVSTVIVLRNCAPVLTSIVEYFVRGNKVNLRTILSELVIIVGAMLYTQGNLQATPLGLFWIFCYIAAQVAYGILLKYNMDSNPELAQLSKFSMAMYNNVLALPLVIGVLFIQNEQVGLPEIVQEISLFGWAIIAGTCFFGFLLSTSGFGLQKLVSATTFIVINNLTKFVNILIGIYILHDRLSGGQHTIGCLLALFAGAWYSYEQLLLAEQAKQKKV